METWSPDPLIAKANHENKLAEMQKLAKIQNLQLALEQVSIIARSYHWLALSITNRVSHSCCRDLTDGPSGWNFGQYFEAEVVNWVLALHTWVRSALKKSRLKCLKSRLFVILHQHNLIQPVGWGMVYVKCAFHAFKGFFFNLKLQRLKAFALSLSNNTKQCLFVSNKAAWVLAHIALALIN